MFGPDALDPYKFVNGGLDKVRSFNIFYGRTELNNLEIAKEYETRTSNNLRTVSRLLQILVRLDFLPRVPTISGR